MYDLTAADIDTDMTRTPYDIARLKIRDTDALA
jgi:hypothetical protein